MAAKGGYKEEATQVFLAGLQDCLYSGATMLDGKKVRLARRRQGMTQLQLAEAVGCDNNTLSRLEKGKIGVSLKLGRKIASALGASLESLLAHEPPAGSIVAETELERDVLEAMRRVGEGGAREIRAYAMGMLSGGTTRAGEIAAAVERGAQASRDPDKPTG